MYRISIKTRATQPTRIPKRDEEEDKRLAEDVSCSGENRHSDGV